MGFLLIFLLFALAQTESQKSSNSAGSCGKSKLLDTRVVGGKDTNAESAPWNVILELKIEEEPDQIVNHCGGNILNKKFVLTAAHCFWGDRVKIRNPQEVNVYVGRSSIRPKIAALTVKRIILHEKWNTMATESANLKLGHDIALLQLTKELVFSDTVQPICLPNPNLNIVITIGKPVTVNGYGLIRKFPSLIPEHLQSGNMEIKDKMACNASWSGKIEGDQLCAYGDGVDSCNGDSGGGLTLYINHGRRNSIAVLVGLTSFGSRTCKNEHRPGVYTNVLSHVDWIEQEMQVISNNIVERPWHIGVFPSAYWFTNKSESETPGSIMKAQGTSYKS